MEDVKKEKRRGRAPKAVKKEIRAAIRFSRGEYFIIREKAAGAGVTPSFFIRQTALYATIKPRLTEEERQFVRQLIGMANNLNQLVKSSHREGMFKTMLYFEEYRKGIDEVLQKLRHGK